MKIPIIDSYLNELITRSTIDIPAWNLETTQNGRRKSGWSYVDGCMILAMIEMHRLTGEKRYLEFADSFIDHRVHEDGSIDGYSVEEYNIDSINAGKTLFSLYDINKKEKYRRAIDLIYSQIQTHPRTQEGNFWHKKIYPNQVWLDGLYMAQPFYMEYETRFNDRKNYDDIFLQFQNVVKKMRDPVNGLYFHAYDASKTAFWCNKETGLCQHYWLRALGWYSMALVDTLEKCDPDAAGSKYAELKEVFVALIDSMLGIQDMSGMWYQLPAIGYDSRNYLETSGTAIFAYSILKAVRLGFLPEYYRNPAIKAFYAIIDRYLIQNEAGKLHLGGICLVAGLGPEGNLRRDGSYEYYLSEPIVVDDAKGVAPFILAYTELYRLNENVIPSNGFV